MKKIGKIPPFLLYCLVMLSTFTETVYSSALPEIVDKLNTTGGTAQFSTTIYYLGFALGILTLGRISDIWGRKPIILFGISIYTLSTLSLSYAPNIETFIAIRFIQAYGASVGSVIGQAMTRDSYDGWELSYMYASVSMVMAIIPSIGSAIGGYIVEYYSWQYSFKFLTIVSTSLLLIYIKFLPETNSYIGAAKNNSFFNVVKVAIKDKVLLSYAFIVGAYNGICFGFYIQAPFIFIEKLGLSPSKYGQLFFLLSIASLLGSLINRYLIKKFVSTHKMKVAGLVLSNIGCISLFTLSFFTKDSTNLIFVAIAIFAPMIIHLIGHSLIVPMLLRHALEDYYKVTGSAGSIFGSLYYFITSFVSSIIAYSHSTNIDNFASIFLVFHIICVILFYLTIQWKKQTNQPKFD